MFDRPGTSLSGAFHIFSGNRVASERHRGGAGMLVHAGKRYCEGCHTHRPRGSRRAQKGWRCDACRSGRKAG